MGIFQAGLLVSVPVAPVVGGALAGTLGWRSITYFGVSTSTAGGFSSYGCFFLPGILRPVVGNPSLLPTNLMSRQSVRSGDTSSTCSNPGFWITFPLEFGLVAQRAD